METTLSPARQAGGPGQCFVGGPFDLLRNGQKIAGGATPDSQRFADQGSIQPPVEISRADFERAICAIGSEQWKIQWQAFEVSRNCVNKSTSWQKQSIHSAGSMSGDRTNSPR
jgi:hypothetical protein